MKTFLSVAFLFFLMPALVSGQGTGQGYVFAAPGGGWGGTSLHFGGGGEADLFKGLGFGVEIGLIGSTGNFGGAGVVFSPNGRFAFRSSEDHKLVPYVTGGYSLFYGGTAYNFGGGFDYWFEKKYGLKFEFRNHIMPNCTHDCNLYQIRLGLSMR